MAAHVPHEFDAWDRLDGPLWTSWARGAELLAAEAGDRLWASVLGLEACDADLITSPWPATAYLSLPEWDAEVHDTEVPLDAVWSHPWQPALDQSVAALPGNGLRYQGWLEAFAHLPHGSFLATCALVGFPMRCTLAPQWRVSPNPRFKGDDESEVYAWLSEQLSLNKVCDVTEFVAAGPQRVGLPEGCEPCFVSSPVTVVPKPGSEKKRVCSNLSYSRSGMSVNAATDYTPWEPIDLASLELFFARARFLRKRHPSEELVACKYDLVACFRQLPLRRREWARVGATCRQRFFAHQFVIWGSSSATHLADLCASSVCDVAAERGHLLFSFVDDYFAVTTRTAAGELQQCLLELFRDLGFEESLLKRVEPTQRLEILGVDVDLVSFRAGVSDRKRALLLASIDMLLAAARTGSFVPVREIQRLTGKLNWLSPFFNHARGHIIPLWRLTASATKYGSQEFRRVNWEAQFALTWWRGRLESTATGPHAAFRLERPLYWIEGVASDASHVGFGGVLQSTRELVVGRWSQDEAQSLSINVRECFGALLTLAAFAERFRGGFVRLQCDSFVTVCAVSQEGCNSLPLRFLVALLLTLQERHGFLLSIEHLAGKKNIQADTVSRGGLDMSHALAVTSFGTEAAVVLQDLRSWTVVEVPTELRSNGAITCSALYVEASRGAAGRQSVVWGDGIASSLRYLPAPSASFPYSAGVDCRPVLHLLEFQASL